MLVCHPLPPASKFVAVTIYFERNLKIKSDPCNSCLIGIASIRILKAPRNTCTAMYVLSANKM